MVDTLGPLPEEWRGSYVDSERSQDMWYDPNTKHLNAPSKQGLRSIALTVTLLSDNMYSLF